MKRLWFIPKSAINNQQSTINWLFGLAFFLLYFATLIPSVLSADNGEFQLVAWKLGIAHPPGYPLYTLAGFLFSRLFASPAFALNLLSAVLAAITLVIVSRTVRLIAHSTLAGLLAASLLGVSTTFWAQATTANIRMPTALFTALCVSLLVQWSRSLKERDRELGIRDQATDHLFTLSPRHRAIPSSLHLVIFALVFALGLGHHPSLAFPGAFFVVYILLNDPELIKQPRRWIKPVAFFLIGLLVLLYLPLRGGTGGTLADGESTTYLAQPGKLLDHVLARGFEGDFFYFLNTRPDLLGDRVALLPTLFNFQFNPLVAVLAAWGTIRLLLRNRKLAVLLLGGMVLHTFITITYRAPQTVEYMLPAYVLLVIMLGYGLGEFRIQNAESRILSSIFWILNSLALLSVILLFISHFPSFSWLHQLDDTRTYAESLLNDAPPNAIILSNWHWANPMWYLQQVEGLRLDVQVNYVYPRGSEPLATSWLKDIETGLTLKRPVIVDMFFPAAFHATLPYFYYPNSTEAFEVQAASLAQIPSDFNSVSIDFDDTLRIIGYRLLNPATRPGEPLTLLVAYRVEKQMKGLASLFAHLVNPDGSVIGQADQTIPYALYQTGDVIIERFFVAPLTTIEPGEYTLMAGASLRGDDGQNIPLKSGGNERVVIASAKVEASDQLIDPGGIALSGGIHFMSSTASSSGELHPGDRLTLDLKFVASRPILRDLVVSVQMNGATHVVDDSVPALGAIPTLKWIAGSEVVDRHVLVIPQDVTPGTATVTLSLYDAFTQEPLALLDAELIKQGPTIPLGTWTIVTK